MNHPSGDAVLRAVAMEALDLVQDGATVGLGTGRAATAFIRALGERVKDGLRISGVATSSDSAATATEVGIPLLDLNESLSLDLTVDGADEVAPNLDLIKGWGGALVRERIVAAVSRRQVILVGKDKLVRRLGERGRLPVEIIPFAAGPVSRQVKALGLVPVVRLAPDGKGPFHTENSNLILDCGFVSPLASPEYARGFEAALLAIPGVVDTGLFLGTADLVLVGTQDGTVERMHPPEDGDG